MSQAVADLIAKRFIARPEVKAIQFDDGSWAPHTVSRKSDGVRLPWSRDDLNAHLAGTQTFGHYLLNADDRVKLFAFDIDLKKNVDAGKPGAYQGHWPDTSGADTEDVAVLEFDAREAWLDRGHPSRNWQKYQLKVVAHSLARAVREELDIDVAVAYSGGKGLHVYGFTGPIAASDAREAAKIAIDSTEKWKPSRGDNFYESIDPNPITSFPNISIELFPKQDNLGNDGLGNLMRLPLGKNKKNPKDPTFFVDMTSPMAQLVPLDAETALMASDPFKKVLSA